MTTTNRSYPTWQFDGRYYLALEDALHLVEDAQAKKDKEIAHLEEDLTTAEAVEQYLLEKLKKTKQDCLDSLLLERKHHEQSRAELRATRQAANDWERNCYAARQATPPWSWRGR